MFARSVREDRKPRGWHLEELSIRGADTFGAADLHNLLDGIDTAKAVASKLRISLKLPARNRFAGAKVLSDAIAARLPQAAEGAENVKESPVAADEDPEDAEGGVEGDDGAEGDESNADEGDE